MNFESCGPFLFPRERTGQWQKEFWQVVENYWEGLSNAIAQLKHLISDNYEFSMG